MIEKDMVCIVCPVGCRLHVVKDGEQITVSGNTCKRGERYAVGEFTDPQRTVTSSVYVEGGHMPLASVRTEKTISKAKIPAVLEALKTVRPVAPVKVGDVVLPNAAGTGVNVIATREIRRK
ncbi:MAG: DUF1667 domain-containing protein [Eubacteriales bacterium]|nr:DUF1667 domain-containing protein [Eubacteriales bacterium]